MDSHDYANVFEMKSKLDKSKEELLELAKADISVFIIKTMERGKKEGIKVGFIAVFIIKGIIVSL